MAITTLDGVLAGALPHREFRKVLTGTMVAGRPHSMWGFAGNPSAGSFDTTLNGVNLTAPTNGQLVFSNPVSGNSHLAKFLGMATIAGTLTMADRLWHNGGYTITSTAAQNTTQPTLPARDVAGSTNGDGVLLGLEISATTGAGTPTVTISYTNQSGTSGRTATNINATVASSIAGTFYPIGLQAGDTGVRSVQSLTLSATWTSGTMNLVAYRPIAHLNFPAAFTPDFLDVITSGMPQVYNDTVPFLIFTPSTTTTSLISGGYNFIQG